MDNFYAWLQKTHPKEWETMNNPAYIDTDWLENNINPLVFKWMKPAFDAGVQFGIESERKRHAWALAKTPESEKLLEMRYLLPD